MFALSLVFLSFSAANGQQIEWLTDLDQARQTAVRTGKPILYDFTAKWCGPCRRMDKGFWPKPEVIELSKQFVCVKVDFDREKTLAARYDIKAIPNVVFTDPWGRGLGGQKGFGSSTENEILQKINFLPKDFTPLLEAGKALETDEKNLNALHSFAAFYQERRIFWLGNLFYNRLIKIESDPSKREMVFLNLAFNHLREGEPEDAIDKFSVLQKEFPSSPQGDLYLYGLIVANANKNKKQEAATLLTELKKKMPKSKYVDAAESAVGNIPEWKR